MQAWQTTAAPIHVVAHERPTDDPDPKALACYGLLVRQPSPHHNAPPADQLLLRCVDGRPGSAVTIEFLAWCSVRLAAAGKTAVLLVWDTASWHVSTAVRAWLKAHNQQVKQGQVPGVRILVCLLPSKSPWLNPIEPKWLHGKRAVVEPERPLLAQEVVDRVYAYYGCAHEPHLVQSQKAP